MAKRKQRISVSSAKAKGRRTQNWAATQISRLLGVSWGKDEDVAARPMGQSGTDVRVAPHLREKFPFSVECKNTETWGVPAFIKQAKENQDPNTEWLVIMEKNYHEPVVVLDAKVFFRILRRAYSLRTRIKRCHFANEGTQNSSSDGS